MSHLSIFELILLQSSQGLKNMLTIFPPTYHTTLLLTTKKPNFSYRSQFRPLGYIYLEAFFPLFFSYVRKNPAVLCDAKNFSGRRK